MVIDQFEEMLEQSRKYPLVFAISVHPSSSASRSVCALSAKPSATSCATARACRKAQSRDRSSAWQGPMPVRNLPNTAKVWEAVQGDVRHGARDSVKNRKTGFIGNRSLGRGHRSCEERLAATTVQHWPPADHSRFATKRSLQGVPTARSAPHDLHQEGS
jgi:hypothetical protein